MVRIFNRAELNRFHLQFEFAPEPLSLQATNFGPCEILAPIGKGGLAIAHKSDNFATSELSIGICSFSRLVFVNSFYS